MSSRYQLSQEYNFQTFLWTMAGGTYSAALAIRAWLPTIWAVLQVLSIALGLTAVIVAAVVIVAMVQPVFWLGMGLIAVFGFVTFPRTAVQS